MPAFARSVRRVREIHSDLHGGLATCMVTLGMALCRLHRSDTMAPAQLPEVTATVRVSRPTRGRDSWDTARGRGRELESGERRSGSRW